MAAPFQTLLLSAALLPTSAVQARDVDVSLSLGFAQPGLVGRVDPKDRGEIKLVVHDAEPFEPSNA